MISWGGGGHKGVLGGGQMPPSLYVKKGPERSYMIYIQNFSSSIGYIGIKFMPISINTQSRQLQNTTQETNNSINAMY